MFTVQALVLCELIIITLQDMHKLSEEYPDYFEELFSNANHRSSIELNLKEEAI